jgi:hypothetical protein
MEYEKLIEKILSRFTGDLYRDEVLEAKKTFFGTVGSNEEEPEQFEHHMAQFLDWYLFSRKMGEAERTPIELALTEPSLDLSESEIAMLGVLKSAKHSLFEFLKNKGNDIYLKDLINNKKLVVKDSPVNAGFSTEEYFEARLVPLENNFLFTKGFCFHPSEARKFIKKEIKKVRKEEGRSQEELMLKLIRMRHKYERYKHIKVQYIYTDDPKVKI